MLASLNMSFGPVFRTESAMMRSIVAVAHTLVLYASFPFGSAATHGLDPHRVWESPTSFVETAHQDRKPLRAVPGSTSEVSMAAARPLGHGRSAADSAKAVTGSGQVDDRWISTGQIGAGCNGRVFVAAVGPSDTVYVGGQFSQCGSIRARNIARFDRASATWSTLGAGQSGGVSGAVYAILVDGAVVYAGGSFNEAGGTAASNIAVFDPQASGWRALGPLGAEGTNGVVTAIVGNGGNLYIGGAFRTAAGLVVNNVARFDPASAAWSALGTGATVGVNGFVSAIASAGSALYVGGSFLQSGGTPTNRVSRFNVLSSEWNSLGTGASNGVSGSVFAMAMFNGDVIVGGDFGFAGGAGAGRIARFVTSTQSWTTLGTGAADNGLGGIPWPTVRSIVHDGSSILAAGQFLRAGGVEARNVAQFDTVSGIWRPVELGPLASDSLDASSLALVGRTMYVGGLFTRVGGVNSSNVASVNLDSRVWQQLGTDAGSGPGRVFALASSGSDFALGGFFSHASGVSLNNVGILRQDPSGWSALDGGGASGTNGTVSVVAVDGRDVFVGGSFTEAGGVPANFIAKFDRILGTWSPLGTGAANGVNSTVTDIALVGGGVVVGGWFTQAGGLPAGYVARFNTSTGVWSTLGSGVLNGVNGGVSAIDAAGDDVFVAGSFTSAGGMSAPGVARFRLASASWTGLGSGVAPGAVRDIRVAGSQLIAAGSFATIGGVSANNIAVFDFASQAWSSLGVGANNGVDSLVAALAVRGSDIYVGGAFTRAGLMSARRVARFDRSSGRWFPLGSGVQDGGVQALAIRSDGLLAVGGSFGAAGGSVSSNLAIYRVGSIASVVVVASPQSPMLGQPVSFTASVARQGSVPIGSIAIEASTGETCSFNLPVGSCTITFGTVGPRSVVAVYAGDETYEATVSTSISVVVSSSAEDVVFVSGFEPGL